MLLSLCAHVLSTHLPLCLPPSNQLPPTALQATPAAEGNDHGAASSSSTACRSFNSGDKGPSKPSFELAKFNGAYVVIFGVFGALFLFHNPYLFAVLSILTIIPQNSQITSLNTLVLLFYDSGLFMNFAEAVFCARLVTWLSIACTLISFAVFT